MKLAIMTQPTFFVEEDKILTTLFEEGMDNLHLYKPEASPLFYERLLSLLPEECRKKTTVHNNFYLKNEYELAGIHLDNSQSAVPDGYKGRVSRTCKELSQLKAAAKQSRYVFLCNIFDSLHDKNERASFSIETLERAAKDGLINKHVYALSGMSMETIGIAKSLGFGGVVVCGDLWNRFNIQQHTDYKELIRHFIKIRKAVG